MYSNKKQEIGEEMRGRLADLANLEGYYNSNRESYYMIVGWVTPLGDFKRIFRGRIGEGMILFHQNDYSNYIIQKKKKIWGNF